MAFKHKDEYLAYENITASTVDYKDDIETIYKKCVELSKKFEIPIGEFLLEAQEEYGDPKWVIQFCRKATSEEIEEVKAEEKRREQYKRQQYEALKKEFE